MRRDLIVPKEKYPLDALAEQGERICNAWIFLHVSVVLKLEADQEVTVEKAYNGGKILIWKPKAGKYWDNRIIYRNFEATDWYLLTNASAENIAFKAVGDVEDPEEVIFVTMEGV